MTDLLVTATLPATNGLAEDDVVNTFAFQTVDPFDAGSQMDDIAAGLGVLYNVAPPESGVTLASRISEEIKRTTDAVIIRAYDITGKLQNVAYTKPNGQPGVKPPAHGSPIGVTTMTLGAEEGAPKPLPRQVAAVLTLRGQDWQTVPVEAADNAPITRTGGGDTVTDPGTAVDRPKQRLSGRLFLGPFNDNAIGDAPSSSNIGTNLRTTIINAAGDAYSAWLGLGLQWSVWSRTLGQLNEVTHIQVDDSWDIQRRRKKAPSTRTTLQVLA